MNRADYQELLGRLLEGALSDAEAAQLAAGLRQSPELLNDLRRHLVLWELWSQQASAERSADAFLNGYRTRLRAEREGADPFCAALRDRLQPPESFAARCGAFWRALRLPARLAWAASVALMALAAFCWFASPRTAQATTLTGQAVCSACVLHESHQHTPAVRVTEAGIQRVYYLDLDPAVRTAQDYFCAGTAPVVAKGKARTENGRLWFKASTVTFPETNKPKAEPTNNAKVIFPI